MRPDPRLPLQRLIVLAALCFAFAAPGLSAGAQPAPPAPPPASIPPGLTDQPCPSGSIGRPAALLAFAKAAVTEGPIDPAVMKAYASVAAEQAKTEELRVKNDWADLCLYRTANAQLLAGGGAKVVYLGDSITELWQAADPEMFTGSVADRGISGQTSGQALLRFYPDVVALHPKVVHVMIGTNDIAGNNGPSRPEDLEDNILAMVEIARANRIRVVLASIPPAASFSWRPEIHPTEQILAMNRWLSELARREGLVYVDYYSALAAPGGGMREGLSRDGVHPLIRGYDLMKPLALEAVAKALREAR